MERIITIVQVILAVLLIISILLQQRGTGLGGVFGSELNVYRSKRGIEKFLFVSTIVIACLFAISTVLVAIRG